MAPNPRYLQLLADIATSYTDFIDATSAWDYFHDAWTQVTFEPSPSHLKRLSEATLTVLTHETGKSREQLVAEAAILHANTNAGYAGADNPDPWANFRLAQVFGVTPYVGVLVRLSDKYVRLKNLRHSPSNERIGESVIDTLRDAMAYALIGICLWEEEEHATA